MPKAYWIARIDVHDPETYKLYVEAGHLAYERYNAKFLARGGRTEVLEGAARPQCGDRVRLDGRCDSLLQFSGIHQGPRLSPQGQHRRIRHG